MDEDAAFYESFTKELTSRDNVVVIPKSGAMWDDLKNMMDEHLSHHQKTDPRKPAERNNELLVVANVAGWPRTKSSKSGTFGRLLTYQFISSIRNSSLFQQYGLVRMLLWTNEEDKRNLVPRTVQERRKMTMETEMSCEWIREVVGRDDDSYHKRDYLVDLESGVKAVARMNKHLRTVNIPPERQTDMYKVLQNDPELMKRRRFSVEAPPRFKNSFQEQIDMLESKGQLTKAEQTQLSNAKKRLVPANNQLMRAQRLLQLQDKIRSYEVSTQDDAPRWRKNVKEEWDEEMSKLSRIDRSMFDLLLEMQHHLNHNDPPTFFWDRRLAEPLVPQPEEFIPNAPLALIDVQPKAPHRVFLERGPGSTRSADITELIIQALWLTPVAPVKRAMDNLWPGFAEEYEKIDSLRNPKLGGFPYDEFMTVRRLRENQLFDVVERFLDWPFRPDYRELFYRHLEYSGRDEEQQERMDPVGKTEEADAEAEEGEEHDVEGQIDEEREGRGD